MNKKKKAFSKSTASREIEIDLGDSDPISDSSLSNNRIQRATSTTVVTNTTNASSKARFECLDSYRGLLAYLVIFDHAASYYKLAGDYQVLFFSKLEIVL